jgi:hypothetical protein
MHTQEITTFVGRERELRAIRTRLDEASTGRVGLILISGESGAGKSRLLDEGSRLATEAGFAVAAATCWQGQGTLPLWPWIQALRGLDDAGLPVDRELAVALAEGAQSSLLSDVDPTGARFRLFDRVVRFFAEASRIRPILVVLDDLHWSDRTSVDLLVHVATRAGDCRLAIAGGACEDEAGAVSTLAAHATVLRLGGLPPLAVAELSRAVAGRHLGDDTTAALTTHTTGNPFFVKELVRLVTSQGGWKQRSEMPSSVRDLLEQRMASLDADCRSALDVGAVVGVEFDVATVAAVLDRDVDATAASLADAVTGHIVDDRGDGRFRFGHDLYREVVYEELAFTVARRLHAGVASALEYRYSVAGAVDDHVAELAHHFVAAGPDGDAVKAVDYSHRAGAKAAAVLAFDDAVGYLQQAVDAVGDQAPLERARLLVALGDVSWRARDQVRARTVLREAVRLARSAGAADVFADAALSYAGGLGGNQPIASADHELIGLLEDALSMLDDDDSTRRCRVLGRLATELSLTDDDERRDALSAAAVEMAHRLDDPRCVATALYARQMATFGPDGAEERAAAVVEILGLAERTGDTELALWGHLFHNWSLVERGLPVDEGLARCARLAEQLGAPGYRAEVAMRQAIKALLAGNWTLAEHLQDVVEAAVANDPAAAVTAQALAAAKAAIQGPHEPLAELVAAILEVQPERVMWRSALALIHVELGQLDEGRRHVDEIAASGFALPRDSLWLSAMYYTTVAAFATGADEYADVLHEMLLPYAHRWTVGVYGAMATPVGLIEAMRGDDGAALRWLELGRRRSLATDNQAMASFADRERAAVLLRRDADGDRAEAATILDRVLVDLRRYGFTAYVARAECLAAQAGR